MVHFKDVKVGETFVDVNGCKLMKFKVAYTEKHSKSDCAVNCILLEDHGDLKKGTLMFAEPSEGVSILDNTILSGKRI